MKTALLLAAGMGKRLGHISQETPKPLLPVAGKTLLRYMVEFVRAVGCDRIVVVAGYQFEKLRTELASIDPSIIVVNNPDFHLQNLISFSRGLEQVGETDLFVCNVDYIFKDTTVAKVKSALAEAAVYCSYDLSGDASDVMKVEVQDGLFTRMSKQLTEFQAIYTGMFFFPAATVGLVKELTAELLATSDKEKTTVEALFPAFANRASLAVADVGIANWFEIDTEEEWLVAKRALE